MTEISIPELVGCGFPPHLQNRPELLKARFNPLNYKSNLGKYIVLMPLGYVKTQTIYWPFINRPTSRDDGRDELPQKS